LRQVNDIVSPTGGGNATAEPGRAFFVQNRFVKLYIMKGIWYPRKVQKPNGDVNVVFGEHKKDPACPVCQGTGKRHDAKTGHLRDCVLCKGTGFGKWK